MDWIPHFGTGPDLFFTCRAPDQHQFAQYDPPAFQFNMDAVIITLRLEGVYTGEFPTGHSTLTRAVQFARFPFGALSPLKPHSPMPGCQGVPSREEKAAMSQLPPTEWPLRRPSLPHRIRQRATERYFEARKQQAV